MTVGRFAPSPSGRMHLGNLFCCLLAWLSIRKQNGKMILRIEDLDTVRCTPGHITCLIDDLNWLGFDWDEGPEGCIITETNTGTKNPLPGSVGTYLQSQRGAYLQSQRTERYREALETLKARGLVYPCFCTRAELHAANAPHRSDGQAVYPGICRTLSPEEVALRAERRPPAMRLRVPDESVTFHDGHMGPYTENLALECGDFLLRRSDGLYAYQLAVVVDDAVMGVTEVARGADLLPSTPRQLYLYRLLGYTPPEFFHVPLLLSANRRRLSKRDGDLGLDVLRERFKPEEILGKLAFLGGFHPTADAVSLPDLIRSFDWNRVPVRDITVPEGLFL